MKISQKTSIEIIEILIEIAENFDAKRENYLISYPHFLNYFKNLQKVNIENLVVGISFTYSWMPTILKSINLNKSEKVLEILNKVRNGGGIVETELVILKETFNNSLVGSSKLLHFINPTKYAIWDSRVFRFLNNEEPHKYKIEKPNAYLNYLKLLENIKNQKNFIKFYELMKQKVGYEITEYRAIELAFFKGK